MSTTFNASLFEEDFRFLKELKDILIEELFRIEGSNNDPTFSDSELKSGFHTETDDGREVRVVFPAGFQKIWNHLQLCQKVKITNTNFETSDVNQDKIPETAKKEADISFVGFIGNKNDETKGDAELLADVNTLDTLMLKDLAEIDGMLAYVTGERVKGGDYGNLVLFKDRGVVSDLFKSTNHAKAVNSVAPRFYRDVRIHSGRLQEGVTSSFFVLQKTLFLCFTLPREDPGRRRVQMWRACREECDVMKVSPRPSSVWRC